MTALPIGLALVAWLGLPADLPAPVPTAIVEETACPAADFTPAPLDGAEGEVAGAPDALAALDTQGTDATPVAKPPCKPCKDRPFCVCSYQGRPRISCNPCCYQGPFDPFPVCFD